MKFLCILSILFLSGCSNNPKFLLIEYPIESENSIMRFPGVRADTLEECLKQSETVKEMRDDDYKGRFQCGTNCRFSIERGSPLCDELIDL